MYLLPMPLLAPVINATLPTKLISILFGKQWRFKMMTFWQNKTEIKQKRNKNKIQLKMKKKWIFTARKKKLMILIATSVHRKITIVFI